jgi:hypothetical protein
MSGDFDATRSTFHAVNLTTSHSTTLAFCSDQDRAADAQAAFFLAWFAAVGDCVS